MSSSERGGVYDCGYGTLADEDGWEFVTEDDKLVKNLQSRFPFIISLSTLP